MPWLFGRLPSPEIFGQRAYPVADLFGKLGATFHHFFGGVAGVFGPVVQGLASVVILTPQIFAHLFASLRSEHHPDQRTSAQPNEQEGNGAVAAAAFGNFVFSYAHKNTSSDENLNGLNLQPF
jgi:hypothetical protein